MQHAHATQPRWHERALNKLPLNNLITPHYLAELTGVTVANNTGVRL